MHLFKVKNAVVFGFFALAGVIASAQSIFDFRNTSSGAGVELSGLATGSTSVDDLTMVATLFPDGVFNQTKAGFGVNAVSTTDNTHQFDPGEGFTFSFNQDVLLTNISVSSFGDYSHGLVSFQDGQAIAFILKTGPTSLENTLVTAGTILRFESNSTETTVPSSAFSLDSITVAIVPEASAAGLVAGVVSIIGVITRRRRRGF